MGKRETKAKREAREAEEAKTARFVLEQRLNSGGFCYMPDGEGLSTIDDDGTRDENGNVWFSVTICITSLDIEDAPAEDE